MRFTESPVVELAVGDAVLSIQQDNGSIHVGTSVWPCSLLLVKFVERWLLQTPAPNTYSHLLRFPGKRAVELGSGCGPAGMGLLLLGLDVALTDIAPVMPALRRNLKRNRPALGRTPRHAQLYWNNPAHIAALRPPFDFVVAADVVYLEDSVPHLVSAMEALLGPDGTVLLGYQLRSPEAHGLFWDLCHRSFSVHKVPREHLHPDYAYEEADVYLLRKK
uniref:Methyltransferase-like protein 21D n=1 Tax=Anthurium amnicola TaxID=1678845 RepID=A0A1D1XVV3_9ARAE